MKPVDNKNNKTICYVLAYTVLYIIFYFFYLDIGAKSHLNKSICRILYYNETFNDRGKTRPVF